MLFSRDGTLLVARASDFGTITEGGEDEQESAILARIDGIPNDGGAW